MCVERDSSGIFLGCMATKFDGLHTPPFPRLRRLRLAIFGKLFYGFCVLAFSMHVAFEMDPKSVLLVRPLA